MMLSVDVKILPQFGQGLLLARGIMPLLHGKSTYPGCSVFRSHLLMPQLGIQGIVHGKAKKATEPHKMNRQFRAPAPNTLWFSDFTYVSTWQGCVYVAFCNRQT